MNKTLKAWERIKKGIDTNVWECGYWDDIELIEKEFKALEIIKRNPVEVVNLIDTYNNYKEMKQDYYVYGDEIEFIKSEDEFNLLKEVLL